MNLVPGQWEIGNTIFGRNTLIRVMQVDAQPGDVQPQDFQVPQSDEIRFGQDSKKPGNITFTLGLYKNKAIANTNIAGSPAMNFANDPTVEQLAYEWDAYAIRTKWGEPVCLRKCSNDGITQRIYGRTSKFGSSDPTLKSQFRTIQCEFRRMDDKTYSDVEYGVSLLPNAPQTATRVDGMASSWVRFVLQGKMDHPTINFGSQQIELNYNLEAGEAVEISSYPWQRRCINQDNENIGAAMVADSPYLDQITFPPKTPKSLSWTATNIAANARMLFFWRDAYAVML